MGGSELKQFKSELKELKQGISEYLDESTNPFIVVPKIVLRQVISPSLAKAITKMQ